MNKIAAIFFVLSTCCTPAQEASESNSKAEATPESTIHRHLQNSTSYGYSQLDSALFFANKAMQLAKELDNDSISAKVRANLGGLLILSRRFDEGEKLLYQNIEVQNGNRTTLGMTHNNLGNSYNLKEEFDRAAEHYLKAAKIFEPLKDTLMLGRAYGNLGVVHARLKDYRKAILYMGRAVEFAEGNEVLKINLITNLAAVHYEEGHTDKAISVSHEAEKLAIKNKTGSSLATVYSNLCKFYLNNDAFDTSITYGLRALELKKEMGMDNTIVLNNLGYAHLRKGDNPSAARYLKRALPSSMGETRSLIYKNLSETLLNMGAHQEALEYANEHIKLKDSLDLLAQQKNVRELIEKYESEKTRQQLDLLNTKNELNQTKLSNQRNYIWALALFSSLAILVGFLLYRNYKTTQSLNAAKIQHRLLQTQLNPHFLFNALNNIQAFGYSNDREKLSEYVDSFSKLMRFILESSDQDFITVEEDSRTLNEYLYLQRSSSENGFETKIEIHPKVDPDVLIPPMFTQPFVENSVLHGVRNKKGGLIEILYSEANDRLLVQIQDNGDGVNTASSAENKLHRSMGIDIVKERVDSLQKINDYKCSIEVDSGEQGTTVLLTFPIRYAKLGQ